MSHQTFMQRLIPLRRPARATAAAVLLACAAAACSSSTASTPTHASGSAAAASQAPLAHLLPASIASSKVITVATLDGNAPWDYFSGPTFQGIDADILAKIGPLLGVTFKYYNIQFPAQIPGLLAGRFNIVMDSIGDTTPREQTLNFLEYGTDALGIAALKGNPEHITTDENLCGKRATVLASSTIITSLQQINKSCTTPMTMSTTDNPAGMDLAVVSGRADFAADPYSSEIYAMRHATSGYLTKLAFTPVPLIDPGFNAIAFKKSDTQLLNAFRAALQQIISDGSYVQIMASWGVVNLAVKSAEVNAGPGVYHT